MPVEEKMTIIDVLDNTGEKINQVDLAESIFDIPVKASVLHEVVRMQLAGRRSGARRISGFASPLAKSALTGKPSWDARPPWI